MAQFRRYVLLVVCIATLFPRGVSRLLFVGVHLDPHANLANPFGRTRLDQGQIL